MISQETKDLNRIKLLVKLLNKQFKGINRSVFEKLNYNPNRDIFLKTK